LYCFEDHLVHSVKFRLKIWYIIDSLIRTHDPDDNWPRTTLAFHFSIRNLGGQMVEFSISERKTPTPELSPPASQCGWYSSNLWRFGSVLEPSWFFGARVNSWKKTTSLKGYPVWQENKLQTLLEQSLSVCKRGKNVHPIEMISSEPFCQFERLYIMISAECTVQRVERMVVRTVRIYDSIYYDMHDLRLLVIDMSFLSTSLRLTYHQLVPLNLLSS